MNEPIKNTFGVSTWGRNCVGFFWFSYFSSNCFFTVIKIELNHRKSRYFARFWQINVKSLFFHPFLHLQFSAQNQCASFFLSSAVYHLCTSFIRCEVIGLAMGFLFEKSVYLNVSVPFLEPFSLSKSFRKLYFVLFCFFLLFVS